MTILVEPRTATKYLSQCRWFSAAVLTGNFPNQTIRDSNPADMKSVMTMTNILSSSLYEISTEIYSYKHFKLYCKTSVMQVCCSLCFAK